MKIEFFPEVAEHETIVQEQPAVPPLQGPRVPGYDQLFRGNFPTFKSEPRG